VSNPTALASPPNANRAGQSRPIDQSHRNFQHSDLFPRLATWIGILDWFVVAMVAVAAVALHVRFVTHVGGLWRDEANSVQLASLPRLGDVWHFLEFDSFPLLYFTVLRFWTAVFGAHNDSALRALGLLTGLGILAAVWITVRMFGAKTPVLSLALIGLNPMIIRYGDSTRAYGLGIILILLTLASFWRLVASPSAPSRTRLFTTAVLAVLSVQCVYYNSVLLLSIIAAAIVVCVRKRSWRTAAIAFGIGVVAAGSLLPYVPMMRRMHEWTFLVSFSGHLSWLWQRSCEVTGAPDPIGTWIWSGLFIASIGVVAGLALLRVRTRPRPSELTSDPDTPAQSFDAVLFAAVCIMVAVPVYAGFLLILRYYTQPWYYIVLAAFVACAMDVVFGARPTSVKFHPSVFLRGIRPLIALGLLCLAALPDWKEIIIRHTNTDLIAARLQSLAVKDDLVLVAQWEAAVSLSHHYRGPAEIVTIPDVPDHRFHRYDLVLRQMMADDPSQPLLARLKNTLRSNHSIFIVGELPYPPESLHLHKPPLSVTKNSNASTGGAYYLLWKLQVGQLLKAHVTRISNITVPVPDKAPIQSFENLELQVARGWR